MLTYLFILRTRAGKEDHSPLSESHDSAESIHQHLSSLQQSEMVDLGVHERPSLDMEMHRPVSLLDLHEINHERFRYEAWRNSKWPTPRESARRAHGTEA